MKIAVIGCGYWGPNLIRNFYQSNNVRELICCDLDQKRLDHLKGLYPSIKTQTDYRKLLDMADLAAVVVATPVKTHYPLAKEFLLRRKAVLLEKPMAHSYEAALELVKLAEAQNCILMVDHTFEYSAAVKKIKTLVDQGDLGEILYVSSTRVNLGLFQPDINVVWDLAPHDISIILHVLDKVPVSVNCQGKAHYRSGIEDVAQTSLNFENGKIAFIHNSWLDPNKIRRTTFVGSKKMLVYDDIETQEKIKIYDKGVDVPPHYDSFADFHFSYRYGDIHSPRIDDYEPLKKECDHFLQCIRGEEYPWTDGYNGMRVVSILEAAGKSLKLSGMAVPVETYEREVKVIPAQSFDTARLARGVGK
jgi:predicted dehydrogenase